MFSSRQWTRRETLRDGAQVLLRPLRPEDAALYPEFLEHVTPEDLRLRFFAPMRELRPELIERLTHLDYETAMALIAIDEATGKMLGVVRLHDDVDGKSAEFAVIVRSELKGHGLGWVLMHRIIDYAKWKGLKRVHGQVLAENTTMLQMCKEMGFHVGPDVEAGVKVEVLDLDEVPHISAA